MRSEAYVSLLSAGCDRNYYTAYCRGERHPITTFLPLKCYLHFCNQPLSEIIVALLLPYISDFCIYFSFSCVKPISTFCFYGRNWRLVTKKREDCRSWYHWHECSNCHAKKDEAPHEWNNNEVTAKPAGTTGTGWFGQYRFCDFLENGDTRCTQQPFSYIFRQVQCVKDLCGLSFQLLNRCLWALFGGFNVNSICHPCGPCLVHSNAAIREVRPKRTLPCMRPLDFLPEVSISDFSVIIQRRFYDRQWSLYGNPYVAVHCVKRGSLLLKRTKRAEILSEIGIYILEISFIITV